MFWWEKEISKAENTLFWWILQNILENQRIAKFIMADFYEIDFMKGIVILVKADEMYNMLKSASQCLLVERWRLNWMIKVFAGVCPWMSIRLLRPSFNKGRHNLVRETAAERGWYCNLDDTGVR